MLIKLLLAGDGGQGIQTIADIICRAVFTAGHQISHIPNYGLEQRGGVSLSFIQISDTPINYPKFSRPDILLIMSEQAKARIEKYQIGEDTKILDIKNYKNILENNKILVMSYNIFFLGVLTKILQQQNIFQSVDVSKLLEEKLSKKNNWEDNEKAFGIGLSQN